MALVQNILQQHVPTAQVWAFGSRAKWLARDTSDLDLCIRAPAALIFEQMGALRAAFEESNLPWKVDVVDWASASESFRQIIQRDRVVVQKAGRCWDMAGERLNSWIDSTLGELVEFQRGFDLPVGDRQSGAFPVIAATGPIGTHDSCKVKSPGVVIGRSGSIGGGQFIDCDFWPLNTTLWVKDFRGNDPRFTFYFVKNTDFSGLNAGSSVPTLNRNHIHRIPARFPTDIDEQRAIAGVLSALDDKIDQNRRTAGALERLARAIFRAWFVDFEPVKAKATGATAFPSMPQQVFDALPTRFVESDIGPVPEGWKFVTATEVGIVAIGKTPPRKEPQWFTADPSQMPWVSIRDMGTCGTFIRTTSEYLTHEAVARLNIRRIPDRSVLLSFNLTLWRVAIAVGDITSNEAIAHFIPNSPESIGTEYLYCYLSEFDQNRLGSTSSIATATNSKVVKAMPILVPTSSVAMGFTDLVRPVFDSLRSSAGESAKLAELRDYLLPRLLSGSVRVRGAYVGADLRVCPTTKGAHAGAPLPGIGR